MYHLDRLVSLDREYPSMHNSANNHLFKSLSTFYKQDKTCLMPYAKNKGTDQHVHSSSLISVVVVPFLDGIMPVIVKSNISRLYSQFESYLVTYPENSLVFLRRGSVILIGIKI